MFVDQSPIGKTTRSNPASYVGAFDEIRKLFAKAPLALQRGYGAGTFSFNSGDGRCPTCGGSGFEHIEMQFLSDVYLRCPDCDGSRYRAEILEVRIERDGRALSIADVLDLTVSEAAAFFATDAEVLRVLQPIVDVGLEYVKLGQPVPTLSGGEAQRLKLAGFLAESAAAVNGRRVVTEEARIARAKLFMFDEPTTGLHFDDIAKLMQAFGKLLAAGHSLIVIEHNLDVIRAADWLIDLGPEGGDGGGLVLCAGTPDDVKACAESHTGVALLQYDRAMDAELALADEGKPLQAVLNAARERRAIEGEDVVRIVNAREHNLKALDVDIPHGKFNVITGVSGSGKSTLAFDILFHEGQRRYLESLNAYARSIVQPAGRPEVDAVYGIPPTVAIEQRPSRGGRKSTVATTSEVWHFLRLLYVKLGLQHCIHDGTPVTSQSVESIAAQLLRDHRGEHVGLLAPLVVNRKGVRISRSGRRRAAARICASMASSCRSIRGRSSTASASIRSSCRWPTSSCRRTTRPNCGACSTRRSSRQGRDASARAARRAAPRDAERSFDRAGRHGQGAVGQARVPGVRHELPGAGPADVLVQQQAWLVHDLRRHRRHAHARTARRV